MSADKSALFSHAWRLAGCKEKLIPEYRFHTVRKFRLDFAVDVYKKIGIEVDGGQWCARGGRHNTDKDREKMNLLAEMGWIVFRFSPDMLKKNPIGCAEQVRRAME